MGKGLDLAGDEVLVVHSKGLPFEKIEACGNDFLLVDQEMAPEQIAAICDRHHGIGADGIMRFKGLENNVVQLEHIDPDGSHSFCLNGTRASLACLIQKGLVPTTGLAHCEGTQLTYEYAKPLRVTLAKCSYESRIWCGEGLVLQGFFADVGNPQFILIAALDEVRFRNLAACIRADLSVFPQGTNVNLLYPEGASWRIHTFERGVEDFTLACGSGMLAAATVLFAERQLGQVTFVPDGHGSVTVEDLADRLALDGRIGWAASGVYLCGS